MTNELVRVLQSLALQMSPPVHKDVMWLCQGGVVTMHSPHVLKFYNCYKYLYFICYIVSQRFFSIYSGIYLNYEIVKDTFNCKMRMPGTVKCRPTVAY